MATRATAAASEPRRFAIIDPDMDGLLQVGPLPTQYGLCVSRALRKCGRPMRSRVCDPGALQSERRLIRYLWRTRARGAPATFIQFERAPPNRDTIGGDIAPEQIAGPRRQRIGCRIGEDSHEVGPVCGFAIERRHLRVHL